VDGGWVSSIWLNSHTDSGSHGDKLCSPLYGIRSQIEAYVIANHMPHFVISPFYTQSPCKSGLTQTLQGRRRSRCDV